MSSEQWRLYETGRQILSEIESHLDWEKLYDLDAAPDELLSWGLYLEEALRSMAPRMRAAFARSEPDAEEPNPRAEELEDHLWWGTRQVESGLQQAASLLSRAMVELITAGTNDLPLAELEQKKRALAMPLAEVAGKLRSDLRKLTTFLVAEGRWDPDKIELLLFPQKREELQRGVELKERLVLTMQGFQGSDDRLPISEVLRLWRSGQALGQAALAEIDTLIRGLLSMLDKENRRALYVDSYYRLLEWIRHLERCSRGLQEHLGDESVEDTLTTEIAAILDAEILAEILGDASLRQIELPRDLTEILPVITRAQLKKLELKKAQQTRLLDLKSKLEDDLQRADPIDLQPHEKELLFETVTQIRGQKMVDQLRLQGPLPESMEHLEHLHPLVLAAEDGLRTYLTLLYGQIQNRDLHLLREDQADVPIAEKRLAVSELEYRLSKLEGSQTRLAFEAVRHRISGHQKVPDEEWEGLQRFLDHLQEVIAPRLERLASFPEVGGLSADGAGRLRAACEQMVGLEEPPSENQQEAVGAWMEWIAALLAELKDIRIVMTMPQTEAELEDFLNMMG